MSALPGRIAEAWRDAVGAAIDCIGACGCMNADGICFSDPFSRVGVLKQALFGSVRVAAVVDAAAFEFLDRRDGDRCSWCAWGRIIRRWP